MIARGSANNLTTGSLTAVSTETSTEVMESIAKLRAFLTASLQGKDSLIEKAIAGYIAGGHLLLEGPPGTGKTSLAKGFARAVGGSFNRIQMTSDLLPSDVVGVLRLNPGQNDFEFREGPIFANFVLADELNRTPPKTQGALLEAMEEGTVSVDRKTYPLPKPFFLIATQNPMEFHGVYPLAESQLDRFMLQLNFDPPSEADELRIYLSPETHQSIGTQSEPVLSPAEALRLRGQVHDVYIENTVLEYLTKIVRETRQLPGVSHGVSVRGGIQFLAAVKAYALVKGRNYVLPQDVVEIGPFALAHRLTLIEGESTTTFRHQLIQDLFKRIPSPR